MQTYPTAQPPAFYFPEAEDSLDFSEEEDDTPHTALGHKASLFAHFAPSFRHLRPHFHIGKCPYKSPKSQAPPRT